MGTKTFAAACAALIALTAAPAAHAGDRIYGITNVTSMFTPHVISFDSAAPNVLLSDQVLVGLPSGERTITLDSRPNGGALYVLTRTTAGVARLYTVDPATGSMTFASLLAADPADVTAPFTTLATNNVGMDFDPVTDRLRIIAPSGANLRVNPDTGLVITDGDINAGMGADPNPQIPAIAYTNPLPGATAATLYGYDINNDDVVRLDSPNTGTVSLVGSSGVIGNSALIEHFDIAPSGVAYEMHGQGGGDRLYTVNLATGAHTITSTNPPSLFGLTASTFNLVSFANPTVSFNEGVGSATVTLTRANARGSLTVRVATSGGTATPGEDYTAVDEAVTFADGETSRTVSIPLADDGFDEADQTIGVAATLPGASDATVIGGSATVNLIDDGARVAPPTPPTPPASPPAGGGGGGTPPVVNPPAPSPKPGRCANPQRGTSKDDALVGTSAGDKLTGLGGADALFGGAGDDCLEGGAGDDWLSGGDGNDTITAGAGVNVVRGGTGNDVINTRNRKRETVDCGAGKDTVTADKTDKLKGCEKKKRR